MLAFHRHTSTNFKKRNLIGSSRAARLGVYIPAGAQIPQGTEVVSLGSFAGGMPTDGSLYFLQVRVYSPISSGGGQFCASFQEFLRGDRCDQSIFEDDSIPRA